MFRFLAAFARRDGAQGMMEYALIVLAVIAIACCATMVLPWATISLTTNTYGLQSQVGQWNT